MDTNELGNANEEPRPSVLSPEFEVKNLTIKSDGYVTMIENAKMQIIKAVAIPPAMLGINVSADPLGANGGDK